MMRGIGYVIHRKILFKWEQILQEVSSLLSKKLKRLKFFLFFYYYNQAGNWQPGLTDKIIHAFSTITH